jgi:hypothetical protein
MNSSLELYITVAALFVAGILAMSGLVLSKRPDARQMIDKLVPYQGVVGVGLLAWGLIQLVRFLLNHGAAQMSAWPLGGAVIFMAMLSALLLGFLFGMPMIAKWIPGSTPAEQKAMEMQQKVAGFSVLLGIVGIAAGVGLLLIRFGILTPSF